MELCNEIKIKGDLKIFKQKKGLVECDEVEHLDQKSVLFRTVFDFENRWN